jgi:hypothetical protein
MVSMSTATYLEFFAQAPDLPAGMSMPQDSRTRGADPGDQAFHRFGGLHAGLARWHASDGPISRLIDIRAAFPDATAARNYARAVLQEQMENMLVIKQAPLVGSECVVVGGRFPGMFRSDDGHTSFCYLFTVGPVWVKLSAADYSNSRMTLEMVHGIAQNIERRITSASPGAMPADRGPVAAKSW